MSCSGKILLILSLILLTQCAPLPIQSIPVSDKTNFAREGYNDQIAIFSFELYKGTGNRSDSIVFVRTDTVSAWLKTDLPVPDHLGKNMLKVSFLDKDLRILKATAIENPLQQQVEYQEDDTSGVLKTKTIEKEKAECILRTRYDVPIKRVRFEKLNKDETWITLAEMNVIQ